jgi:ribosomal-protein-alanine N-acetyltransferase
MQKCGFIKDAERKAYVWHDGRLKDRVEYKLLRDEWKYRRAITENTDKSERSPVGNRSRRAVCDD